MGHLQILRDHILHDGFFRFVLEERYKEVLDDLMTRFEHIREIPLHERRIYQGENNRYGYRAKFDGDTLKKESFTLSIDFLKNSTGDQIFGLDLASRVFELIKDMEREYVRYFAEAFDLNSKINLPKIMDYSVENFAINYGHYFGNGVRSYTTEPKYDEGYFTVLLLERYSEHDGDDFLGTEFLVNKKWTPVHCEDFTLPDPIMKIDEDDVYTAIVYPGKMIEQATDGKIKAVAHRSIVPPGGKSIIKLFPDHQTFKKQT